MNISRTRIKICGITRVEDALVAASCGADALGLNFFKPSPRCLTMEQASKIIEAIPAFVSKVGLFVDAGSDEVQEVLQHLCLDYLQFHGDESEDYCRSFGKSYIKALKVGPDSDFPGSLTKYPSAAALLLDTWHPELAGGTGESFDWSLLKGLPGSMPPLILAGGLHAGNVAAAIRQVRPYAVDVSSGVEDSPGIKSAAKISEFINEVSNV